MNDSNARYLDAMTKLYGSSKPNICQHPRCKTIILKSKRYCLKHSQGKQQ